MYQRLFWSRRLAFDFALCSVEEGNCFLDRTKSHVCVDNVYGQIYSINIAIGIFLKHKTLVGFFQVAVMTVVLRLYDDEM